MRPSIVLLLLAISIVPAMSQDAALPLESVTAEGSVIPQPVILEIAGLRIESPIDKGGIDQACKKLEESGLFASISYRYAPGPKTGYVLTLALADQAPLTEATIDVPGADENEAWQWLFARFRRFDRQAPQVDSAQKYLATEIERHIGGSMRGQHLTVRIETDLRTRKLMLSFQPEVLPRVQSVVLAGNQAVASSELNSVLNRVAANAEYTDRKFAAAVELNLRPLYEEHGFYRVQFAPGRPQLSDAGVSLSVAITEGATYQLGKVEIAGENLPVEAMFAAARMPTGKLANWRQIQQGLWDMERVVKRTGFFEAAATADRTYDDAAHVLQLRIRVLKGPLYHFGEIHITGLTPAQEQLVRRTWTPKPGDPYDFQYPNEFFQALARVLDLRNFRRRDVTPKKAAGDHVIDFNMIFEPR